MSRLCAALDSRVRVFNERPLGCFPFLLIDALYVKVHEEERIVSRAGLLASVLTPFRAQCDLTHACTATRRPWPRVFKRIFRADLIVENKIIVELKFVEKLNNAHKNSCSHTFVLFQ
ncbi:MAG: transposase [Thiogranum sp.]